MSVSAKNYLVRPKPSTFLIKVSYNEAIIKISALNRFLLARFDWRFHVAFRKAALGCLKAVSTQRSAALAWCSLLDLC